MKLLLLDYDANRCQSWAAAFKSNGFTLDIFEDVRDASEAVEQVDYDALLINHRLPAACAFEWFRSRKSQDPANRFIFITKLQDVEIRLRAYEAGADDCLLESIDTRELIAKVRALLRRGFAQKSAVLETGNLRLDTLAREAYVKGVFIVLPRRELSLLEHFMNSTGRTLSREYLETTFYGATGDACPNSIEVRVSRLRRRLADADADVEIKTIRGVGYRFQLKEQDAS